MTKPRLEAVYDDPFYYGRRQLIRYDKTGQPSYRWQPLTQEDFLDPQPGDEFMHGPHHDRLVHTLRRQFRYHHRYNPAMLVVSNMKIAWDKAGLAQPAPDLALIPQVREPERHRTIFDVAAEDARPRFILEVTSPRFAELDLNDKRDLYAAAGVDEYWIVDASLAEDEKTPPLRLLAYQLKSGQYNPLEPEAGGRLYSAANRLWIGLDAGRRAIILVDERSGQRVAPDADFAEASPGAQAEAASRAQSIAEQLDFSHLDLG